MKRFLIVILMCVLFCTEVYAEPKVNAKGAVLMDADNGRVLWGKNENEPLAMASTTKIMTAVIALERADEDETVTISKNAAKTAEVNIDLKEGEQYRLGDLLYALMLKSANDAAVAVAEHIGGSVEAFADIMNEKAFEIGAKDTLFVTPNGLDEGEHHSTAADMALIAAYALKNKRFLEIITTASYEFNSLDGKRHIELINKNRLLNEYNGAVGVKTGFTVKAGHCFVGAAKREDVFLVSTVLASGWGNSGKENKWSDTKEILNFGFENYKKYELASDGCDMGTVPVSGSEEKEVSLVLKGSINALLSEEERENIRILKIIPEKVYAPIEKGDRVGFIRIYTDDFLLGEADICAKNEVSRKTVLILAKKLADRWFLKDEEWIKCLLGFRNILRMRE